MDLKGVPAGGSAERPGRGADENDSSFGGVSVLRGGGSGSRGGADCVRFAVNAQDAFAGSWHFYIWFVSAAWHGREYCGKAGAENHRRKNATAGSGSGAASWWRQWCVKNLETAVRMISRADQLWST